MEINFLIWKQININNLNIWKLMNIKEVVQKAQNFEQNLTKFYNPDIAKQQIQEFNKRFPKEKLSALTIEEYSLGYTPDSFSNWVEKRTKAAGQISGGSSNLFYLWSNQELAKDNKFKVGRKGDIVDYGTAQKEFEKIKALLLKIVELAGKNGFKAIDEIDLLAPIVKSKIVFLYFPDKITPLMKHDFVKEACDVFDVQFDEQHTIESNHRLLTEIKKIDYFKEWDALKIGSFFYSAVRSPERPNIFLAPRSGQQAAEGFQETLENGYSYEKIKTFLSETDKEALSGFERVYIWGNRPGRKSAWDKIRPEDWVLFYQKGRYTVAGKVFYKTHNSKLAEGIWGKEDGVTWEYVFVLTEITPIDIDAKVIQELAGYSSPIVQDFHKLNQIGIDNVYQKFDSIESFLSQKSAAFQKTIESHFISQTWDISPEQLRVQLDKMYFDNPDALNSKICNLVNSGSNIILVGAPGTGKTEIALALAKLAQKYVLGKASEHFVFSTATSDWTTFDTIGGYMPTSSGELEFKEGQFLRAIREDKVLIIDEINRAEIDKAFGQLFTLLSGQSVELPFLANNKQPIRLTTTSGELHSFQKDNSYFVGKNWRIFATMNTLDKAALYQMSYAFMRRFAFVHIDLPSDKLACLRKINEQHHLDDKVILKVHEIWERISSSGGGKNPRQIGPAIFGSILKLMKTGNINPEDGKNLDKILAEGIVAFVLPQFEGANTETELKPLAKALANYELHIGGFFEEMFGESLSKLAKD